MHLDLFGQTMRNASFCGTDNLYPSRRKPLTRSSSCWKWPVIWCPRLNLMSAVWPDSFVEEQNVAVTISMLRKALGDEGPEHRYIRTVSRQGYRFVGDVEEAIAPQAAVPVPALENPPTDSALRPTPPVRPAISIPRSGLMAASAVAATVAIAMTLWHLRPSSEARPSIASLAVLPFRSRSLDPARDCG